MTDPAVADAAVAALLFAVDPVGTGAVLRSPAGPARDAWLQRVRDALPTGTALRRVPPSVPDDRLLGGVDLPTTLATGRPVHARGLLAEAAGGVLVMAMAERLPPGTAARVAAAADGGGRFGLLLLDEGEGDEGAPPALLDRVALLLDLPPALPDAAMPDVAAARARLPGVVLDDGVLDALCRAAAALGVGSLRAPLHAMRVARAAAALAGRGAVSADDAALAARLVLAPRATQCPQADAAGESEGDGDPPPDPPPPAEGAGGDDVGSPADTLEDRLLQAAVAAIPAGLLDRLRHDAARHRAATAGKAGAEQRGGRRGRPASVRPGDPRRDRLNLIETLRAAAPWQALRRPPGAALPTGRLAVRASDLRVTTLRQRSQTTTIFAVDASGSAALARLAEAKGAVELLLAECYVRRDQVAVVAFRGRGAQLLLEPTRSLVRAKRSLAGLPGGGGTPLAAGIDAGAAVAASVRRRGGVPTLVLLTDGRANVGRDGRGDRARAEAEALASAGAVRSAGLRALLVDTAARPHPPNARLAERMGARYVPLPYADAAAVSRAVQAHR